MNFSLNGFARRPDDACLLDDLRAFSALCGGRAFSYSEYRLAGRFYPSIFLRRFGSWNRALLLAGLQPKRLCNVGADVLVDNLRCLWLALGRQPTLADLIKPLSGFGRKPYLRVFGSWSQALRCAALESGARELGVSEGVAVKSVSVRERASEKSVGWRARHLVMKRDGFRCVMCGTSPAVTVGVVLQVDHIVPQSKGGSSVIENLQTLCEVCNGGKSNLI